MARLYFVVGAALLILAIGALLIGVSGLDNPLTAQILQQLHCRPHETIGWVLGSYTFNSDGRGGRSVSFHCEDSENQQRDITLPAVITIAAPFVVLLLASILAMVRGGQIVKQRAVSRFAQIVAQGGTARAEIYGLENIPPERLEMVEQVLGINLAINTNDDHDTLAEKLEQLAEARRKGLITEDEYERTRQEILNNLAD